VCAGTRSQAPDAQDCTAASQIASPGNTFPDANTAPFPRGGQTASLAADLPSMETRNAGVQLTSGRKGVRHEFPKSKLHHIICLLTASHGKQVLRGLDPQSPEDPAIHPGVTPRDMYLPAALFTVPSSRNHPNIHKLL
jgi:hypothetical protein